MEMKYIIALNSAGRFDGDGKEYAIIFPKKLVHREVAGFHRASGLSIRSAGFVNLTTGECYGESESLGEKSRPEDTEIMRRDLGLTPA